MKRFTAFLLAVLLIMTILPAKVYAEVVTPVLQINPYGGERESLGTVKWYKTEDYGYYMFLPSDADLSKLTVYIGGASSVKVGLKTIKNGETTDVFSRGGLFTVKIGNESYSVIILKSENLPAVYINTESGSLSYIHQNKDNKESGTINISVDGEFQLESSELKQIKGRGNSSWWSNKKSYNIKFAKKTSILGMDAAKKWALVSSTIDNSFVRNALAWYLADRTGLKYSSDYRMVDLYANGVYLGLYIICENVEVGKNRVAISDLEDETKELNMNELDSYKLCETEEVYEYLADGEIISNPLRKWVDIPNDPEDISGGYLLELEVADRYDEEVCGFVTDKGDCVVIKAPEYASKAQVDYIADYWQEAEDALYSETGYNDKGNYYTDYFDMEALVNMYILEEFSGDIDPGVSSSYFYKDKGGKLVASPAWDFDYAFGREIERMGHDIADSEMWLANRFTRSSYGNFPTIYNLLFRHQDFRDMVNKRWTEVSEIYGDIETQRFVDELALTVKKSAIMNGIRWKGVYTGIMYAKEVLSVKSFLFKRTKALNIGFSEDGAQLFYDLNGGSGYIFDCMIYKKGDTAIVTGTELTADYYETKAIPPEGYSFSGWNTEKDGSGKTYYPGSILILKGDTTLYAQWVKEGTETGSLLEKCKTIMNKINNDNDIREKLYTFTKLINFTRHLVN